PLQTAVKQYVHVRRAKCQARQVAVVADGTPAGVDATAFQPHHVFGRVVEYGVATQEAQVGGRHPGGRRRLQVEQDGIVGNRLREVLQQVGAEDDLTLARQEEVRQ